MAQSLYAKLASLFSSSRKNESMIIKPRVRGFLCITTHPVGCEANVKRQIDYVRSRGAIANGPKRVLVIERGQRDQARHRRLV